MILVVGATGQLGGRIARALLGTGRPVRVLVRAAAAADGLLAAGADVVHGDLKDADSLIAACAGVDAIVTTANAVGGRGADTVESVDRQGNIDLVDAASAAGVRRFVFTSALGAHSEGPAPFLRAKAAAEQHLRDSGMSWTILQLNVFMDVWVPAVVGGPALAGEPVTLVGQGRRRHSFVAVRDVAAYAVAILDRREAERQTLPIGGPEALTWRDVVKAFEAELRREIPVRWVPPGERVPGLPDTLGESLAFLDTYDSPVDMTALSGRYGVAPTPLAEFVHHLVTTPR